MMDIIWTILAIGIVLALPFAFHIFLRRKTESPFARSCKTIHTGMTVEQAINELGRNYTVSFLKDGTVKLEWRYRNPGSPCRIARGVYINSGEQLEKFSVLVRDGWVTDTQTVNLQLEFY